MPRHFKQRSLSIAIVSAMVMFGGLAACTQSETTASLLADAKKYQQKGDTKAALIQVKNAVAKGPQDGEARVLLSTLYLEAGDAVSAEKEIRKATALGIGADRTAPILAKALLLQGQFQKALDALPPQQANASAPLLTMRGDASLALRDGAAAKAAYEQALVLKPDSGDAMIGMARYALTQKDTEAAGRYAAAAAAKDANNPEVWNFQAALLRSQGKPVEALAAYERVLTLKPNHRSANIEKAQIEIGQGKFDAARADLNAARKVAPGELSVLYTQAMLDFNEGKLAQAHEALQKLLGVAPDHMPTILLASAVELRQGAPKQAEQHLRKYLQANPQNMYARKLLAQALLESEQPGEATAVLAPALEKHSDDAGLLALAGQSSMSAKDFTKATSYFEQASALAPKQAALHTSLGLSKLAQGDQAKALSEMELGASLESTSPNAGITLVRTQMSLKHYDEALAAALALEKQRPADAQVQAVKGAVYMSKGDRANGRASFAKALTLDPNYFPAVVALAQADVQDHKPLEAKQRFEAFLAKNAKHIGAMTALAELAVVQGHPEEAVTWLEKASAENPEAIGPAIRLAGLYLQTKRPDKTLNVLRKFQTSNPTHPELLGLLGQAQVAANDPNAALETYGKLVTVLPQSALAQLRLAGVHMMLKNDTAAAEDLKRAVALDPDLIQARLAQVDLALRNNNPEQAMAIARALQKRQGQADIGLMLEGDLLMRQNKPAQALAPLEKAYALKPSSHVLVKIAAATRQLGKGKEADARLAQWEKAHPDDATVTLALAEGDLADKQYKAAIERFEAVLKKVPNNPLVLNNLAWAYQQVKDPRALATAERALQLAPNNAAVMDTMGWMLLDQGNTARALPLLQKASDLAPQAAEIRYHLAVGLNKSGDKSNARKELTKLLADNKPFPQIEDAKAMLKAL